MSTDLDRSQAFFEALFGWTFRAFMDDMRVFGLGDDHIGGLMKTGQVKTAESPSLWFEVEDIDASLAKASELGAPVVSPKGQTPSVGWTAQIGDPDGNAIGLVQFAPVS